VDLLTAEEARVVGCLVEKEATVPDSYPLTLNSLRLACNQSTSRDPIVSFGDGEIVRALDSLKTRGMVRFVHASHGSRTTKYRHVLDEALRLEPGEVAIVSLLLLRGAQTAGELRTRSERQHDFASLGEVEEVLSGLAARDEPLVVRLARQPGQRDERWAHLLSGEPVVGTTAMAPIAAAPSVARAADRDELVARIEALEAKVADLQALLDNL
jgi:uncharacterized protein YceH (UPF0502 family)